MTHVESQKAKQGQTSLVRHHKHQHHYGHYTVKLIDAADDVFLSFVFCWSGSGALKIEHLDVEATDQDCASFLQSCVHCNVPLPDTDSDVDSNVDLDISKTELVPCKAAFGLCCKENDFNQVKILVQNFNDKLKENEIRVGDLLHFSTTQTSMLAFFGSQLKRPTRHIQWGMIPLASLCMKMVTPRSSPPTPFFTV